MKKRRKKDRNGSEVDSQKYVTPRKAPPYIIGMCTGQNSISKMSKSAPNNSRFQVDSKHASDNFTQEETENAVRDR